MQTKKMKASKTFLLKSRRTEFCGWSSVLTMLNVSQEAEYIRAIAWLFTMWPLSNPDWVYEDVVTPLMRQV